ncbi:hypothetical protein NDU88_002776 [Pleurodeles waltl]|uniref:Uncharacterized protein n=1 Tax=Pleurodeles waltl TaxID=8319 RepID=A0AAV7MQM8_PLEWA|nr:hypothetical protein NDU88_002776 [Pleurodeles waltl]
MPPLKVSEGHADEVVALRRRSPGRCGSGWRSAPGSLEEGIRKVTAGPETRKEWEQKNGYAPRDHIRGGREETEASHGDSRMWQGPERIRLSQKETAVGPLGRETEEKILL